MSISLCMGCIDDCHLPLKCPAGRFKNLHSILLMGMVEAKYHFIWARYWYSGNSLDSIICKSIKIPLIGKDIGGVIISPIILGDSAFPFMKPFTKSFTNAVLTPIQGNIDYRLSRESMVVECSYGQLKGHWIFTKSTLVESRSACLACIVLHKIPIVKPAILGIKPLITGQGKCV